MNSTLKPFSLFLSEAKQVGTLYHYTNLRSLSCILGDDYMKGYGGGERISFTRDSKFHARHVTANICNEARITIDGDKLSTKYKIGPFHDLEWFKNNTAQDFRDEMEEVVKAKRIADINRYIKEIRIMFTSEALKERGYNTKWTELIQNVKAQCKLYDIPLYSIEGDSL